MSNSAGSAWGGWLGPLGRYRPGLLRHDLAQGYKNCERFYLPQWARLPQVMSPEEKLLLGMELSGKVVYDIGAHVGTYTMFFSGRVGPAGYVVAFEPQATSFAKLVRNLKLNGIVNVRAENMGVGDAQDTRTLFMLPGMRTTASLALQARSRLRMRAGTSRLDRLDDLVRNLPLPMPDFMKIDVEGMEQEVLAGAAEILERAHPGLLIEIHGNDRKQKAQRACRIAATLEGLGYAVRQAETGQRVSSQRAVGSGGHLFAQASIETLAD